MPDSEKKSYQKKNFGQYSEALRRNIKERRLKKKEERSHGNYARQVDQRASNQKQDD